MTRVITTLRLACGDALQRTAVLTLGVSVSVLVQFAYHASADSQSPDASSNNPIAAVARRLDAAAVDSEVLELGWQECFAIFGIQVNRCSVGWLPGHVGTLVEVTGESDQLANPVRMIASSASGRSVRSDRQLVYFDDATRAAYVADGVALRRMSLDTGEWVFVGACLALSVDVGRKRIYCLDHVGRVMAIQVAEQLAYQLLTQQPVATLLERMFASGTRPAEIRNRQTDGGESLVVRFARQPRSSRYSPVLNATIDGLSHRNRVLEVRIPESISNDTVANSSLGTMSDASDFSASRRILARDACSSVSAEGRWPSDTLTCREWSSLDGTTKLLEMCLMMNDADPHGDCVSARRAVIHRQVAGHVREQAVEFAGDAMVAFGTADGRYFGVVDLQGLWILSVQDFRIRYGGRCWASAPILGADQVPYAACVDVSGGIRLVPLESGYGGSVVLAVNGQIPAGIVRGAARGEVRALPEGVFLDARVMPFIGMSGTSVAEDYVFGYRDIGLTATRLTLPIAPGLRDR